MPEQQLETFLAAVKADARLQETINAATDSDAVVAIAHAAGFLISTDKIKEFCLTPQLLSDAELEGVTGGASCRIMINGRDGCI
jgi:predicted ribosomally synthesized peptide with nif11-like leader